MSDVDVNHSVLVRIEGELTIYRAAELCQQLKAALDGLTAGGRLDVDLSGVSEMDSAGAQLLIAAHKTATGTGRELRIAEPAAAVLEVLEILQLADRLVDAAPATL